MMRLAVVGAEPADLANRIQGASARRYCRASEIVPSACDALALLDPQHHDEGLIDRCLADGKHVLLAAPTFLAGAALGRLSERSARSGAHLALLNPDRFLPSRRLIRQQLDAGRLGEPGLARMHRWCSGQGDPFVAIERDLDVASWLIGRAPHLIYATESAGGSCLLHLGFPDGRMALIDRACCLPAGDGYQSLSLIASSGAAYADDHQNVQLLFRGGAPRAVLVSEAGRETLTMLQEFVGAVDRGDDLSWSLPAWQRAIAAAAAARQSAATGRAISLDGS